MRVDKSTDGISYKIKTLDAIKVSILFEVKPQNIDDTELNSNWTQSLWAQFERLNDWLHVV